MDAVQADLGFEHGPKDDPERGAVGRHEADLVAGVDLPTEGRSPEAGEPKRVVGVDADVDQSCSHISRCRPVTPAINKIPRGGGLAANGVIVLTMTRGY